MLWSNAANDVRAGRGADSHKAGHKEGEAAALPLQHQLELRHAPPNLGGPRPQGRGYRRRRGTFPFFLLNFKHVLQFVGSGIQVCLATRVSDLQFCAIMVFSLPFPLFTGLLKTFTVHKADVKAAGGVKCVLAKF